MSLKDLISPPLEAGPSVLLDAQRLPAPVDQALGYAARRLARKQLHIDVVLVRQRYQMPEVAASASASASASSSPELPPPLSKTAVAVSQDVVMADHQDSVDPLRAHPFASPRRSDSFPEPSETSFPPPPEPSFPHRTSISTAISSSSSSSPSSFSSSSQSPPRSRFATAMKQFVRSGAMPSRKLPPPLAPVNPAAPVRSPTSSSTPSSSGWSFSSPLSSVFSPSSVSSSSSSSSTSSSAFSSGSFFSTASSSSTPMTPATPLTPTSLLADDSSHDDDGFGLRLLHDAHLPEKHAKMLRRVLTQASRRYDVSPSWQLTAEPTLATDVVAHSRSQPAADLFAAPGLAVHALDRLYAFKTALARYARRPKPERDRDRGRYQHRYQNQYQGADREWRREKERRRRLEDAVDELRRYVLSGGGGGGGEGEEHGLALGELNRRYVWLRYGTSDLEDVVDMYQRAYGERRRSCDSGVESLRFSPRSSVNADQGSNESTPTALTAGNPGAERDTEEINEGVEETHVEEDDDDDVPETPISPTLTRLLSIVPTSVFGMTRQRRRQIERVEEETDPEMEGIEEKEAEGDESEEVKVATEPEPEPESEPLAESQTQRKAPVLPPLASFPLSPLLPPTNPSALPVLSIPKPPSPKTPKPSQPLLKIQTTFSGKPQQDKNGGNNENKNKPKTNSSDKPQIPDLGIPFFLEAASPTSCCSPDSAREQELTARPSSSVRQTFLWTPNSAAVGGGGRQPSASIGQVLGPQPGSRPGSRPGPAFASSSRDRLVIPPTPNGYDDISPITRSEWGFLVGGQMGRQVQVTMC